MMKLPISIPEPPDWKIDWEQLHSIFDEWFEEMTKTPQQPEHHGEGDVFAVGGVQTGILCFGYAPIGLVDYGDAIVFCGVFVTY